MNQDSTRENTNIKREINRFVNRFFYSKERTTKNLSYLYFLLDDIMNFLEEEQTKIGNELLDKDFEKEFIPEKGIKLWLDSECGILIDNMTKNDYSKIAIDSSTKFEAETMIRLSDFQE